MADVEEPFVLVGPSDDPAPLTPPPTPAPLDQARVSESSSCDTETTVSLGDDIVMSSDQDVDQSSVSNPEVTEATTGAVTEATEGAVTEVTSGGAVTEATGTLESVEQGLAVADCVIDNLREGIMKSITPQMNGAKGLLNELLNEQGSLIEQVQEQNSKYESSAELSEMVLLMEQTKVYKQRLVGIRKDMAGVREQAARVKKKALKLQELRQKKALQHEQEREREQEREKQLTAKFTSPSTSED